MFPLSWVLGTAGAVLIVVGAIGGGFSFSGSVIPRVGAAGRVVSLALGAVLVLGGLVLDPALAPPPEPVPVTPSTGESSQADSSQADSSQADSSQADSSQADSTQSIDQKVVDLVRSRPSFAGSDGADLVAIAHAECDVLRRGGTGSEIVDIAMSNGVTYSDAVYQLQVSVVAYCDEYEAAASR